jgi:Uma2 family endonuclease
MTEAQYLALPEEKPYLEYVDGVVLQKPMPNSQHRKLVKLLIVAIARYEETHGGDSGPEGRVRMPDGSGYRLPDTAYWASGRPSGDDSLPSLAIEVRSPDQTLATTRKKCRAFRANGVDACWLIDPVARTAEVFEGDRDGVQLDANGVLTSQVMPGFELPLRDLFAVLKD